MAVQCQAAQWQYHGSGSAVQPECRLEAFGMGLPQHPTPGRRGAVVALRAFAEVSSHAHVHPSITDLGPFVEQLDVCSGHWVSRDEPLLAH